MLIALMVIAIGFGAVEIFLHPFLKTPPGPPPVRVDEAVNLSTAVSKSLAKADLGPGEKHTLLTAAAEWTGSPFYTWPAPRNTGAIRSETDPMLEKFKATTVYSGYLEMGRTRIAVINGIEYQISEVLPDSDYRVLNITPASVTLQSDRNKQQIIIPYQDAFIEE